MMRKRFPALMVLLFGLMTVPCVPLPAQDDPGGFDPPHLFVTANQAYRDGDYQTAVRSYEQLVAGGFSSGELLYNLGCAYLKSGELGAALLNYRRAEKLLPRDEDLRSNLAYARGLTIDRIECRELASALTGLCFWYTRLTAAELVVCFIAVNCVFWLLLTGRIFFKGDIVAVSMYVCLFLTAVLGVSAGVKLYSDYGRHEGIVIGKEIMVRSGNSITDTVLFKLHEGTEFLWEQDLNGWVKLRLCDGKKGWVQRQVVEKIALPD